MLKAYRHQYCVESFYIFRQDSKGQQIGVSCYSALSSEESSPAASSVDSPSPDASPSSPSKPSPKISSSASTADHGRVTMTITESSSSLAKVTPSGSSISDAITFSPTFK